MRQPTPSMLSSQTSIGSALLKRVKYRRQPYQNVPGIRTRIGFALETKYHTYAREIDVLAA